MDELHISGKRFISSRRIARDNNYTADYIGQLIRGGKVMGQKVGRAWYVDAVSFDTFLGSESIPAKLPEEKVQGLGPPQPDHFLQEVLPPPRVSAPVVEPPAPPEKIVEPEKKEETYHVPLHITKTEPSAGLRYYSDESSSLPEIREVRVEKSEPPVAYPAEETADLSGDVFAPQTAHRARPLRVAGLAALGIVVFIFSAIVSSTLSLDLSIEGENTASAWYSLHW